jgi:hypothetical protein
MAGNRPRVIGLVFALVLLGSPQAARANELMGAVGDVVGGALAIPMGILGGTIRGPFILGTLGGALRGTFNAIGLTTRGALRLTGVAIPLVARLAPLIPVFL